ncbi:MAG: DEAD-box ATP-dependent RNA helicase CshA (EC [uncultured Campylobacterales bacterium]|uniref:DEAD-box ATP-dependent RNA helicase CshA (EC) n=1 Tax=uncultured Campylobacterales bacterium TaxID=352960 RepID=A0A6S6T4X6_9BACT|nr:MAG: DEAD-box ATP-dependent RNA helicase CshA (EC [uncultured Campylobacterales bacterium]
MSFKELQLNDKIQEAIAKMGFETASPVQLDAIPLVLEGHDLVAQAQTGTGKTAAFGLPMINDMEPRSGVQGLVIVPTRELAIQVSDELFRFGKSSGLTTACVYGGAPYARQIKQVKEASIVIATPGRLIDLLKNNQIKISPKVVVLDEADEMLDMGFLDDIKEIFNFVKERKQTLMFSATMPPAIKALATQILKEPKYVTITQKDTTNKNITQNYYVVEEYEKDEALIRLLDFKEPTKAIIFCKMRRDVDRVANTLNAQGFTSSGLHGDMDQKQRERVIRAFRDSKIEILVATDVAARGLDVKDISHVFNYELPFDSNSYVHRIGRTGRAGRDGVAVSIVSPRELRQLLRIQKDVGSEMNVKVIPSIPDVKSKRSSAFIEEIEKTPINEDVYTLIDQLKQDLDLSHICYKLASMALASQQVAGKDKIGKSIKDVEMLKLRAKEDRRGGGRRRPGGGGYNNRNRSGGGGDRNRSGGGRNRSGGDRNRSGGGSRRRD